MDRYRIKVGGRLDVQWAEWFHGASVSHEDGSDGATSTVTCQVVDQAALRGILERIWDLNLTVISLDLVKPERQAPAGARPRWDL
jgi:hypothetical protein